jgi:hypothetical protein
MTWVWEEGPVKPAERLLLLALADHANDAGVCYPGMKRLAKMVGCSERYVRVLKDSLVDQGYLKVEETRSTKSLTYQIIKRQNSGTMVPFDEDPSGTIVPSERNYSSSKRNYGSEKRNYSSSKPSLTTNEPSVEPSLEFDGFWTLYPKKVGKAFARKAFYTALTKTTVETLMDGLNNHLKVWTADKTEQKFIPNPATWLNQERWDDNPQPSKDPSANLKGNAQLGKDFLPFQYEDDKELVEKLGGEVYGQ